MALPQGPFYRALGRQIREARKQKRLTQAQLARVVGLTRTSITNIETGRQPVYAHVLSRIADVLHVPVIDFLPPTTSSEITDQTGEQLVHLNADKRQWVARILHATNTKETTADAPSLLAGKEKSSGSVERGTSEKTTRTS